MLPGDFGVAESLGVVGLRFPNGGPYVALFCFPNALCTTICIVQVVNVYICLFRIWTSLIQP